MAKWKTSAVKNLKLGRCLKLLAKEDLVTKKSFDHKTTYQDLWNSLIQLRDQMLTQDLQHLAIPKIACGLDKLSWRVVRSMLEEIFRSSGIDILVCCHNPRKAQKKTVDCYFHKTSRCKFGNTCRYRHDDISGRKVLRRGQCNIYGLPSLLCQEDGSYC